MAALTTTLDSVNPSGNIVRPAAKAQSVFGQLADLSSGLISAGSVLANGRQKDEDRSAQNDAEQAVFDAKKAAQQTLNAPVALGGSPAAGSPVPQDAVAAAQRLGTIQGAVNQGSLPAAALDLHLESAIDTLYQKHPESKAVIASYLKGQGYDHYLFRDVENQLNEQQHAVDQKQAADDYYFDAATKAGQVLPTTSRADGIARGQAIVASQTELKTTKDQLEMIKTQQDISETQRKSGLEIANTALTSNLIKDASQKFGLATEHFSILTQQALDNPNNPELFKSMTDFVPVVVSTIKQAKASAIAQVFSNGGSKDSADAVGKYYDNLGEAVSTAWTGDLAKVNLNKQTLEGMQTQFGIDASKSFPLWMTLSKLPGMAQTMPLIFGGDPSSALPKDTVTQIKAELNGWSPGSNEGMYHIQRVAQLLRGDLKLAHTTQEEAQKLMPTLATALTANREAVLASKEPNPSDGKAYVNAYSNVVDASMSLQPGSDLQSQLAASRLVSHANTFYALDKLAKVPETRDEATSAIIGSIGASAHGMQVAKMSSSDHSENGVLVRVYNPNTRSFAIQIDDRSYDKYVKSLGDQVSVGEFGELINSPRPLTKAEFLAKGDTKLSASTEIMNRSLDNLIKTAPYNVNVPKGATPKSLGEFFAEGKSLTNASGEPLVDETKAFKQSLEGLKQEITGLSANVVQGDTVSAITSQAAKQYNIPEPVANWLIGAEGTGHTRVDANSDGKPDSSASGYGQFIDSTAKRFGLLGNGFDYRNDPSKAVPASMAYLRELIDQNGGDVMKALHQYGTLDRRNFKTDEAYQAKVESAKKALGG